MNQENNYKLTIGIECHVQLKTKTKLFSGALNVDDQEIPNKDINHIDFGLPGALPVLNSNAIYLASRAAFALNSKPQRFSKFDRKHYFYPDLPMGYQITQYDQPIIIGGYVQFISNNKLVKINITRAHLEADAGKSIHPGNKDYSLVDLNRSGTPLLEIVSEPDIKSALQARQYAETLYLLMRYADVTNGNLYYGNMRFDVNISISRNKDLGQRVEIKNVNSFKSIERAINYEYKRQSKLLDTNQEVRQETRGWDDSKGCTYSLRSKENADDYRYMPDPDLPPILLDEAYIQDVKKSMPLMPDYWFYKLKDLGLDESIIYSLLEDGLDNDFKNLKFIVSLNKEEAKLITNYIVNIEIPLTHESNQKILNIEDRHKLYLSIYSLVSQNRINSTALKILIKDILMDSSLPDIDSYIKSHNLAQNSNQDELLEVAINTIKNNPKVTKDILSGQDKAIQYLVGQVMKETKGQANPLIIQDIINQEIEKLKNVKN